MKKFICIKACIISGKPYPPGEDIPDGSICKGRERTLERLGLIQAVEAAQEPSDDTTDKENDGLDKAAQEPLKDVKQASDDNKRSTTEGKRAKK